MVSKSVVLECKWAMRGYYGFDWSAVASVLQHLLKFPNVSVEGRDTVEPAFSNAQAGSEFTDALHHASYKACNTVATIDDRKFARRVKKLALAPPVLILPSSATA